MLTSLYKNIKTEKPAFFSILQSHSTEISISDDLIYFLKFDAV